MSATAFQRVRIACLSLADAIVDYQLLLGFPPVWQGYVRFSEHSEDCPSAWFLVNNTLLELLPLADHKAAVLGLVLSEENIESTGDIIYRGGNGVEYSSPEQLIDTTLASGQWVSLQHDQHSRSLYGASSPDIGESGIQSVDHVVLYTNDADNCVKVFGDEGLGLRLALDKNVPEWGGRMLFFRQGQLTLEVIEPTEAFDGDDYFWGIAYQVADMDAVLSRLERQGVSCSEARDGRKPGTKVATVKSHHLNIPTLLVQPAIKR